MDLKHPLRTVEHLSGRRGTKPLPRTLERLQTYCTVDRETDCWLWQGAVSSRGFPVVAWGVKSLNGNRVPQPAARLAYALVYGEIPRGRRMQRTCGNRRCIYPAHVYPVEATR
jgi:hypothetical protein